MQIEETSQEFWLVNDERNSQIANQMRVLNYGINIDAWLRDPSVSPTYLPFMKPVWSRCTSFVSIGSIRLAMALDAFYNPHFVKWWDANSVWDAIWPITSRAHMLYYGLLIALHLRVNNTPGILISVVFKKAFDSLEWSCIQRALKKFQFWWQLKKMDRDFLHGHIKPSFEQRLGNGLVNAL